MKKSLKGSSEDGNRSANKRDKEYKLWSTKKTAKKNP